MLLATVSLNRNVSCATMPICARSDCQVQRRARRGRPRVTAPAGHVVEARHQVGQRGLAAAARPHQRHHFAGFHLQVEAPECGNRRAPTGSGTRRRRRRSRFGEARRASARPAFRRSPRRGRDTRKPSATRRAPARRCCECPPGASPARSSISRAITKLVKSPGVSAPALIWSRA